MASSHLPFQLSLLLVGAALLTAAAPAQEAPRHAVLKQAGTPIRAFYDPRTAVVLETPADFPVEVVGELVPWSRVRVPGGFDVWIHRDYVSFDAQGHGHATRANVNIRPLPSTGPASHALGHFNPEQELLRLEVDGEWVKVRCDASVSAWVETRFLSFPDFTEAAWEKAWQEAVAARAPKVLVQAVEQAEEGHAEDLVPTPEGEAEDGGVEVVEAKLDSPPPDQPREALAAVAEDLPIFHPKEAAIAADPAELRRQVGEELERFSALVTRADANWDRRRADALEDVLGKVMWHSADSEVLDLARADLARLDALRRFYLGSLASRLRGAQAAGRSSVAGVLEAQLASERKPYRGDGNTTLVVSGWMTRDGAPLAGDSLRLERGQVVIPLIDQDGLHDLPSFLGREVVVRGLWQERPLEVAADAALAPLSDPQRGTRLVFVVRELRALPAREQ